MPIFHVSSLPELAAFMRVRVQQQTEEFERLMANPNGSRRAAELLKARRDAWREAADLVANCALEPSDELRRMAEAHRGRADDCGALARLVLAGSAPPKVRNIGGTLSGRPEDIAALTPEQAQALPRE